MKELVNRKLLIFRWYQVGVKEIKRWINVSNSGVSFLENLGHCWILD
jgi:hypothetical protein